MPRRTERETDPLPRTVIPQLATLVSAPPTGGEWAYEIKLDGYRILARCDHSKVHIFTRNGNDWTERMPSLARALSAVPIETAWLDGEVMVQQANGLADFNALQNAFDAKQGSDAMTYFVFDILYLDSKDLRSSDFRTRRQVPEVREGGQLYCSIHFRSISPIITGPEPR